MPDFTQQQYELLCKAIAMGAKKVKYGDEEVEYNSLQDMLALKEIMAADLGLSEPIVRVYAKTSRGLNGNCKD
jgi:hypothetical protein